MRSASLEWVGVRSRTDVAATLRCLLVHRADGSGAVRRGLRAVLPRASPAGAGTAAVRAGRTPASGRDAGARLGAAVSRSTSRTRRGRRRRAPSAPGARLACCARRTSPTSPTPSSKRARVLLRDLPWSLSVRRTRRWQRARRGGVDLRPLLRRNLTRGGDLVDLPRRTRRHRRATDRGDRATSADRWSDTAGSCCPSSTGCAHSAARVEAFLFATRLTRVTRPLIERRGAAVVRADRARSPGLGRRHAHRRGAAHVQPALGPARDAQRSDRADRVGRLGSRRSRRCSSRELARIRRSCRRLIWLNPLLGSAGYEPLTRGMQAALRHVDDFLPVHNLASLEQLANHLRRLPARSRPVWYKQVGRSSRLQGEGQR